MCAFTTMPDSTSMSNAPEDPSPPSGVLEEAREAAREGNGYTILELCDPQSGRNSKKSLLGLDVDGNRSKLTLSPHLLSDFLDLVMKVAARSG